MTFTTAVKRENIQITALYAKVQFSAPLRSQMYHFTDDRNTGARYLNFAGDKLFVLASGEYKQLTVQHTLCRVDKYIA